MRYPEVPPLFHNIWASFFLVALVDLERRMPARINECTKKCGLPVFVERLTKMEGF